MSKVAGAACVLGGFVLAIVFFAVVGVFNKGMLTAAYNKGVTETNAQTFGVCKNIGLLALEDETGKTVHFSCIYNDK
jgi:hypothetical protein